MVEPDLLTLAASVALGTTIPGDLELSSSIAEKEQPLSISRQRCAAGVLAMMKLLFIKSFLCELLCQALIHLRDASARSVRILKTTGLTAAEVVASVCRLTQRRRQVSHSGARYTKRDRDVAVVFECSQLSLETSSTSSEACRVMEGDMDGSTTGALGFRQRDHARRHARETAAVLLGLMLACVPITAFAQSGITGQVKDSSAAVLPGVTVEAASPALIEKVRTAVTDGQGRYSIVDLRPGTYTVTFSLTGFNTVRRDNLELPSSFTATVNAELPVGALEETLTVTGASPVVDVQTSATQTTLQKVVLEAIPTAGRLPQNFTAFLPGVVQATVGAGGQGGFGNASMQLAVHGGRVGESNVTIDGITTRNLSGAGGGAIFYYVNQATVQEVAVNLGGATADQQIGGIFTNIVPKEGGNRLSGMFFGTYGNEHMGANNVSDELAAAGLSSNGIKEQWDWNPAVGGPIVQDRLWFFSSYRNAGANQFISGAFYNVTPQPTPGRPWFYTPDRSRPATSKVTDISYSTRITVQATPRNKVTGFFDSQPHHIWNRNLVGNVSPEATTYTPALPNYFLHLGWKSPVTSRFLLEAGFVYLNSKFNQNVQTDPPTDINQVSALELSTSQRFGAAVQYRLVLLGS